MELNKTRNWIFILTGLMITLIMGLGVWWLYLLITLSNTLKKINATHPLENMEFISLVKYEGLTFIILIFIVMALLLYFYWQDLKKSKAIQSFFASLTHEIKTPLASVRLQAEVIQDMTKDDESISKLTNRLIEGTTRLESELEKSLQLARIERDGNLVLAPLRLDEYIKTFIQENSLEAQVNIKCENSDAKVMAEKNALNVILRNLFENTKRHCNKNGPVTLEIVSKTNKTEVLYDDHGAEFKGKKKNLGSLFYKHGSDKGSGIGLYLIKKLMSKMNGSLNFLFTGHESGDKNRLVFKMIFKNYETN